MKRPAFFTLVIMAISTLFVGACETDFPWSSHGSTSSKPPAIYGKELASLIALEDCEDMASAIRTKTQSEMEITLQENLAYMLDILEGDQECWRYQVALDAESGSGPPADDGGKSASEYSTTNTQVEGVDEADFIKNDGTHIYILADGLFQIIQAWPADEAHKLSTTPIEGTPEKLFVYNDRAVIYSSLGPISIPADDYPQIMVPVEDSSAECTYGYDCEFTGNGQFLKITVVDISNKWSPVLLREVEFSGAYLNSRRIDNAVYTVVVFPEHPIPGIALWPEELEAYRYYCGNMEEIPYDKLEVALLFEQLRRTNTRIIEEATVGDLLPGVEDTRHISGKPTGDNGLFSECGNFYASQAGDGVSFLSLVSFKIDALEGLEATTIFGKPGAVYASGQSLYVAVRHNRTQLYGWYYEDEDGIDEATTVHKFSLNYQLNQSAYLGSGVVKGRVLNQFAMDEHGGYLRIATTTGRVPDPEVHSSLSVVEERSGKLEVVGMVDQIAPTEDIRSVRFNGDLGFIVTFKKTDPLFVLDLSEPTLPVITGELKIPGFSTYMHMMDAGHILSVGYDADDQGSFAWFTGIQLQIMDVTDIEEPTRTHAEVIGTRGSTSDAATNHLAFNYFAPKYLLAVPIVICEESTGNGSYGKKMTFSGLLVYRVTAEDGFHQLGGISHEAPEEDFGYNSACNNWWTNSNSKVKRSIIMDDYVYSVALDKIKISDIGDLEHPVTTIDL